MGRMPTKLHLIADDEAGDYAGISETSADKVSRVEGNRRVGTDT